MRAVGEEIAQALRGMRNRIRARDADRIEALGARRFDKRCLKRGRRQKSGLA
jgi:hypothetical protein